MMTEKSPKYNRQQTAELIQSLCLNDFCLGVKQPKEISSVEEVGAYYEGFKSALNLCSELLNRHENEDQLDLMFSSWGGTEAEFRKTLGAEWLETLNKGYKFR